MYGRYLVAIICFLLALGRPTPCMAAGPFHDPATLAMDLLPLEEFSTDSIRREPRRLVAATLALTLGAFGAHRLYLGTDVKVPIIYGLTFGGFGVLVLIDLGHILFTKELSGFNNNNKVLMWSIGRTKVLTPP